MATASVLTTNPNSSVGESFFCSNCHISYTDNDEYKAHYKSDFHRYNAKRRLVNLAPATMEQFLKKKNQVADLKQKAQDDQVDQSTKCEPCNKTFANKKTYNQHLESSKHKETARNYKPKDLSVAAEKPASPVVRRTTLDAVNICLFCNKECENLDSNLIHMRVAHSFFINDFKFCSDVEGLLKYLAEKIQKEIMCIYCENKGRDFQTPEAIQNHMISKGHCFMNAEHYRDWEPFYDFSTAVPEPKEGQLAIVDEDEDSEWEDEEEENDEEAVDEEDGEEEEKNEAAENGEKAMKGEDKSAKKKVDPKRTKYYYYKNVVKKAQVLSNGEVELANGKIVGNRQFAKYYNQYFRPSGALENHKKYRTLMDATTERSLVLMRERMMQLSLFGTHHGARFQYEKGSHYRKNEYADRLSRDFMLGLANNGVLQKHFRCATP